MKNVNNKKGFTLAELLIVVAVIAVLVAIAIPTFTTQLEKSREARDMSELRAAYASVMAASLEAPKQTHSIEVSLSQTQNNWQSEEVLIAGTDIKATNPTASGKLKVEYTYGNGSPTIKVGSVTIVDKFGVESSGGSETGNETPTAYVAATIADEAAFNAETGTLYTGAFTSAATAEYSEGTVYYKESSTAGVYEVDDGVTEGNFDDRKSDLYTGAFTAATSYTANTPYYKAS